MKNIKPIAVTLCVAILFLALAGMNLAGSSACAKYRAEIRKAKVQFVMNGGSPKAFPTADQLRPYLKNGASDEEFGICPDHSFTATIFIGNLEDEPSCSVHGPVK